MPDSASIFIGYDSRPVERECFDVALHSIRRRLSQPIKPRAVVLATLRAAGLYSRPTEERRGQLWDVISGAPMSTEFAISRFLVPHLAGGGWAVFADADVLARVDLMQLFACADPSKACMVVKHDYIPARVNKMDGKRQLAYARKNWSSVVLWNCEHRLTKWLTPERVNLAHGLSLHQFSWLDDNDIGALDPSWNHLVGDSPSNPQAKLVHFTNGSPNIPGFENCEFADEWRAEAGW